MSSLLERFRPDLDPADYVVVQEGTYDPSGGKDFDACAHGFKIGLMRLHHAVGRDYPTTRDLLLDDGERWVHLTPA